MIKPRPGSYEYSQQFVNPMRRWTTLCKSPTGDDIQTDTFEDAKVIARKVFKDRPKFKITKAVVIDAESRWVEESK